MIKNQWIGIVALVLVAVSMVTGGDTVIIEKGDSGENRLGSGAVTTVSNPWTFSNTHTVSGALNVSGATVVDEFTEGGGVLSITAVDSSETLTEAQLLANNVITFAASTTMPAYTVTLPATSTMTTLLATSGDTRTWIVENPFTAAATTTTLAAGTGVDLQEPDGQNVVIGINNYAYVTCTRMASTDVTCKVDETIPAD